MKMGNDLMPQQSANNPEVTSFQKFDNTTDADQPRVDSKIFPQDLCDSKCYSKDADSLPLATDSVFIEMESAGQDGCAGAKKEREIEFGFDDLVESFAAHPGKIEADEDNKIQSSANVSSVELELSVSREFCKEIDGGTVKDICIDEGVPVKGKILVEATVEEGDQSPTKEEDFSYSNEKVDVEWPVPIGLKSSTEKDFNSCESKVFAHQVESKNDALVVLDQLRNEKEIDTIYVEETCAAEIPAKTSEDNDCEEKEGEAPQEESVTEFKVACDKSTRSSSTPEKSVEETADHGKEETSDMKTEPLPEEATNNKLELSSDLNQPLLPHIPEQEKQVSGHFTAVARLLQRDNFESSFASVGPYTGSVAYSGPIPYSGSLSHRSDASTVSTRSFAFPVLQNEWNFSPVRMQKADRRRHRGWMHGLFCCKF
uniref:Uncharacterized protein n=1 Tax=Kalanchoe fedtschenkoi TaxID=63787 RepID=A0A7N0VC36_KALFE